MIAIVNSSSLFSKDILHLFKNRYIIREEVIQAGSRSNKFKEMHQMPQNLICYELAL